MRPAAGLGLALGLSLGDHGVYRHRRTRTSAAPASPSVDLSAELRSAPADYSIRARPAPWYASTTAMVVQFAVGLADLKPRRELEPATSFGGPHHEDVHSALVLQLVTEGRLALDDSVDQWSRRAAEQLGRHRSHAAGPFSGLPDYTGTPCCTTCVRDAHHAFGRQSNSWQWEPDRSRCSTRHGLGLQRHRLHRPGPDPAEGYSPLCPAARPGAHLSAARPAPHLPRLRTRVPRDAVRDGYPVPTYYAAGPSWTGSSTRPAST